MFKIHSLKNKISLINILILGVVLFLYCGLLYGLMERFTIRRVDQELSAKTLEISDLLNSFVSPTSATVTTINNATGQVILHRMLSYGESQNNILARKVLDAVDRYELRDDYTALLDAAGREIAYSDNVSPELLDEFRADFVKANSGSFYSASHIHEKPLRLHGRAVRLKDGKSYVIFIATSLRDAQRTIQTMAILCFAMIPFVLVLAGLIGRVLAMRVLKTVLVMSRTADRITHEDLNERVVAPVDDEEMKDLVESFNRMIDRLQRSFNLISEFSSHAAHELKTPLAVIRGESEVALRKERAPEEYRQALQANLRESQRMIRVVEDMLLLSRMEHDAGSVMLVRMPFNPFIEDVYQKAKILAEKKEISVTLTAPKEDINLMADENALRRLFLNILDNAIKFTSSGGRIQLSSQLEKKNMLHVTISDTGCGIAPQDLPHIFKRFYHRDRAASAPGNGLGLSIALSIAKAHQGDIRVQSETGRGTTFTVLLPIQIKA